MSGECRQCSSSGAMDGSSLYLVVFSIALTYGNSHLTPPNIYKVSVYHIPVILSANQWSPLTTMSTVNFHTVKFTLIDKYIGPILGTILKGTWAKK